MSKKVELERFLKLERELQRAGVIGAYEYSHYSNGNVYRYGEFNIGGLTAQVSTLLSATLEAVGKLDLILTHLNLCYEPARSEEVEAKLVECSPTEEGDKT